MAFSEFEIKRIEKVVGEYIEKCRHPAYIRNQLDLSFRVEGQSVVIFAIRPRWHNPKVKFESDAAKATFVRSRKIWKIYWMRADLKWHRYDPDAEVNSIEEFIAVVERDEYGCFFR